jgi:hypothetical protein
MTRRSITRLTSRPIRMAVPSVSVTSIPLPAASASVRHAAGSVCCLGSQDDGSLASCTGRNTAGSSGPSVPQRTWWRQFHNNPRLRSCRRATSTKLAPGCSSSATIRSFSSVRQRRRRSAPVIISIPAVVPVLNGVLTSALKISGAIQHNKTVLAGRIRLHNNNKQTFVHGDCQRQPSTFAAVRKDIRTRPGPSAFRAYAL